MCEYLDFLQRYADFAQAVDDVDTQSLSNAEDAYYLEVIARPAQNMLELSEHHAT